MNEGEGGEGGLVTPHTGVLPIRAIQKTAEATGDFSW